MAQDCIRYLKDQRVGTCTFLPLDNITVKPLSERVRSFGSKYRPCVDLLECEDAFKVLIYHNIRTFYGTLGKIYNTVFNVLLNYFEFSGR